MKEGVTYRVAYENSPFAWWDAFRAAVPALRAPGRPPAPGEAAAAAAQTDETLVADARGDLTPAQVMDRKFLALVGGNPGLYFQAYGRPADIRRLPRG